MPHKRNPWRLENVSGLARVMRGYAVAALENQALWHERDISNSSVERVIFPDACTLLDFMLQRTRRPGRDAGGVPGAHAREPRADARARLQRHAAARAWRRRALTREDAYALRAAATRMETWDQRRRLPRARPRRRRASRALLSKEEIERAFSLDEALRHVDAIFERTLAPEGERFVKALVHVTLKPDVLDPQGKAIRNACASLGYAAASTSVRQGKLFEIELAPRPGADAARAASPSSCDKLLANPVIEDYQIVRIE